MFSALSYLLYHSIVNRTVMRFKRLKRPKYLLGGIVGGIYFYFYFFRYLFGFSGHRQALAPMTLFENAALIELIGALVLFLFILLVWILPQERAALAFTEAEVAFLFPAPISRRGLVHFKLVRSQLAILFSTFILVLVTNRFGGKAWIHAAGWWLILSTLNLHLLGASFARTMLLDRGITNWKRRLAILGLLLALAVAVFVWAGRALPRFDLAQLDSPQAIKDYAQQILTAGPLLWLLYPFRLVVRPYLAPDALAFLSALVPVLLILALQYVWVIRSNVAFEEASVEASKRLAEKIAAVRAGNWQAANRKVKAKRPPFVLGPTGPPAVALLWKNLISAGQAFTFRFWFVLIITGACMSIAIGQSAARERLATAVGMIVIGLLFWSLLAGPQFLRQDFRQDLPLADVLKSYPLRGWQIALGELLAPAVILTAIQWLLLVIAAMLLFQSQDFGPLKQTSRGAGVALGVAIIVPMVNFITLLIPNAAVLLFPAWFQAGKDAPQGIEATGQRLISMLAQVVAFIVALIPAALAFSIVFFLAKLVLAIALAIPLAALGAAIVLAAEATLGLILLGRLFERFDIAAESSP